MASAWARLAARGAGVACLGGMSGAALAEGDAKAKGAKGAMVGDNFQYSLGTPESGFSLFLADRTKKVHFIRHAEGFHNVATKQHGDNTCLHRGTKAAHDHPLARSSTLARARARARARRSPPR